MNIYFSCSITGGRNDQAVYQHIVQFLLDAKHQVPTAHLASQDLAQLETNLDPEEVFVRDINWVRECDVLIAEVSTPSHGVGYEVAEAVNHRKPVLCLFQHGKSVSKIITGNNSPQVFVHAYSDQEQAAQIINDFLKNIN